MTFLSILILSLALSLISFSIYYFFKFKILSHHIIYLFIASVFLTFSSLLIYTTRAGGTILYQARGWPHKFAQYNIKDIIDNYYISQWHWSWGPLASYFFIDVFFYFSLLLLLFLVINFIKNSK